MIFSNRIHRTVNNLSIIYAPIVQRCLVPWSRPIRFGSRGLNEEVRCTYSLRSRRRKGQRTQKSTKVRQKVIQLIRWFAFQGFKLIHCLKTGGKGKLKRNACRETSVNESFTNYQPLPIKRNVRPLCPQNPAAAGAQNKINAVPPDTVAPALTMQPTKYETRDLACIVGFHMTSHYVVAQRSQSIDW